MDEGLSIDRRRMMATSWYISRRLAIASAWAIAVPFTLSYRAEDAL
jgi:hypothetical protein